MYTEKEKIDCYSKLEKYGTASKFYIDITDRLTQPKIGCCNQLKILCHILIISFSILYTIIKYYFKIEDSCLENNKLTRIYSHVRQCAS